MSLRGPIGLDSDRPGISSGRGKVKKKRISVGAIMDTIFSFLIYAVILIAVVFIIGQARRYYNVGYAMFDQEAKDAPGTGVTAPITITEGMTASEVGNLLETAGIVDSSRIFMLQEKVSDYADTFVPGTYTLSSEMTVDQIMEILSGHGEDPAAVTAAE